MFYSNQILARKGPLGLVWIAAHLDRQLKRQQINSTSIPASVDTLLDSEVPLALRLSGQLLLGVVRIYARKVNYLQQDCNDALVKIRVALRPADGVNLPPGATTAPVEHITLLAPGIRAGGRSRKAAAAAAAAAGGRDGAANGDDAFVIDIDEFYWDQDVLLGQGGGGFGGFDLNGGFDLGLAPTTSGPLSQDISGVFGMHSSTADQEVFALEDEEAAAVWDLDELEVERLRAAGSQQLNSSGISGLLGLTPGVEGPHRKGAAAAAVSPEDSDVGMRPAAGQLDDDLAFPAAAGGVDEGPTPVGGIDFREDSDAAADLPPTPADGLLSPELEDTAAAAEGGYTGGAEAAVGRTTASARKGLDLAPAGEDETAAATDVDMMDVDGAAAAGDDHQQQQGGDEATGNDVATAAAAAAATPNKTFQRHKASQHQADQEKENAAAAEASAAAKAARQRRSAALLGHKKKVIVDDRAGGAPMGQHHPTTELPAAEIRALLADRAPLMDKTRGQSLLGKRPHPEPNQAPAAAPTPAELLQLQLAPPAPAGSSSTNSDAPAALRSLFTGSGHAAGGAVLGSGSSFGGAVGVLGGVGVAASLPAQIRQLFVQAAQAAAARGGGAAVAPTADLDQIDMAEEGEDAAAIGLVGGLAGSAGALNLRGGVTRNSLSLSLSTPGSAAAAAAAGTPATAAGQQEEKEGLPSAGGLPSDPRTGRSEFGLTPGAAGFGGGYTPGTVGAAAAGQQQQLPPYGDDEQILPDDDVMMDGGLRVLDHDRQKFETHDCDARLHDDLVPWPADDETLMEQPADGADPADVNDGGFTSRTRLVVKHLQLAAAAAAEAAGPSAAATPASAGSSRRRISAAPPPSLAAAAGDGKDLDQQGAVAAPLSFKTLIRGHNRLDACRWFYEVLVLGNKGLLTVKQDEPYGDIVVTPNLAAMARI